MMPFKQKIGYIEKKATTTKKACETFFDSLLLPVREDNTSSSRSDSHKQAVFNPKRDEEESKFCLSQNSTLSIAK